MELHNNLFQNASLAMVIISGRKEIVEVNNSAYAFFGTADEKISKEAYDWIINIVENAKENDIISGTKKYIERNNEEIVFKYFISTSGLSGECFTTLSFINVDVNKEINSPLSENTSTISNEKVQIFSVNDNKYNKGKKVQVQENIGEDHFRTFIQHAPDAIFIYKHDGQIIKANDTACNLLGYTKEELTRLNFNNLISKNELYKKPININGFEGEKILRSERIFIHKSKYEVFVFITLSLLFDGSIMAIAEDKTELKIMRDLLLQSEKKIREAQRLARMGTWELDFKTKELTWSSEVFAIFELRENHFEPTIESFMKCIHYDDREYVENTFNNSVEQKTLYDISHRIVCPDGTIKFVNEKCETFYDEKGNPIKSTGIVYDITNKKANEDELNLNKKQLEIMYNATSAIIYLIAVDNGKFKFISSNSAGLKSSGVIFNQFFSQYIENNAASKSQELIENKYKEAIEKKESINWEEETIDSKGKLFFKISVTPVFDQNNVCNRLVVTVQDITDLKLVSEKILKEKELSDSIINNLPGIFFLFNKDGKFLRWNKNFENFSVYTRSEIAEKKPLDFVGVQDHERIKEIIEEVFNKGNAEIEANLTNKQGVTVPMYFTGWLATIEGEPCVIGMAIDISERKKVETELRQSEHKFNSLVNTIDGIVWEANAKTLKNTFVSKHAEKLLGHAQSDWIDNESFWKDHLHPEDKEITIQNFQNIRNSGQAGLLEYRMIKAGGKVIWIEDIVSVIREDSETTFLRGVMTDITERKQKELELKESHSKYMAIIDNSMNAFLLTNEKGDIIDSNKTSLEMFGYSIDELKGMKAWQVIETDHSKYQEQVEHLKKTGRTKGEAFGIKRNGEKILLAFTSAMFTNANGELLISSIGIDISERINYEESLIKSNERFEKVSEATFDAIWDWDVKSHQLYLGKGFKELFGYDVKNGEGEFSTWADYLHPEDKDNVILSRLNKIIQYDQDKWTDEYRYIRADGSVAYVLDRGILLRENGLTYRMIGAMQDITNSKTIQAELLKSNERFEYVSKATFDAIWDWDLKTGDLYWGDGFEQLFGYKLINNKATIESWNNLIHPEDKERVLVSIMGAIRSDIENWKDDYRFMKSDGTYSYVVDKGIIIRDKNGKAYRMIGAMRDITSRKLDEQKLSELNKELQNKAAELSISNAELESFAYVTSHDLQEPLRMVSSFLQLLQKKYENSLDEKGQKYINFAIDGSERMKILIQDLLEFSRINSSKEIHTQVDLNEVAKKTVLNLRRIIDESNAELSISILPMIYGNESQLLQLFQNLIGNAMKYRSDRNPIIKVGYTEKEEEWEFFIKDNGIGIDEKFFNKIFVIFQRLHNRKDFEGTGIGLAVCKKIVDFHGGKIWVESILGEGSTFYFTISKNLI